MIVALNGLFLGRSDVGTGRYLRGLLRGCAGLEASGIAHQVDWRLIALADAEGEPIEPPRPRRLRCRALEPPIGVLGENGTKLWFEQLAVPWAARDEAAELLHYPYFAAPLRSPARLVVTIHDLIPLVLPEYRGSPAVRLYTQLQAVAARRATLILADSNATRHDVVRFLDVPRQRVRVVPLGVDAAWRPAEPSAIEAVRARLGLPERYIFHASGLDVRKNVERLILAYARVRASHGVTEPVALTGNPDARDRLVRPLRPLIEQLGLTKHVRFVGRVDLDQLRALYSGSALTVVASRYEGFGLPVLEAMACGAPVICSSASSLPEVAGDAALTFDPDDELAFAEALARGLQDEPLRLDLGERGRVRAAAFTWERTAEATVQAYQDVLAG